MIIYCIYLLLLLLMFMLIYSIISENLKYPFIKVRTFSLLVLMIGSLRYIALLIFLISKNIKYLYFLKPLVFLNILVLPMLALISIYIFVRNDKIKYNYCLIVCGLLLSFYILIIVKNSASIKSIGSLGYLMTFTNESLIYGIYIIFNTIFLLISILFLGMKNVNKQGLCMVLFSSLLQICEIILKFMGFFILPAFILGDLFWILTIGYALLKLKK